MESIVTFLITLKRGLKHSRMNVKFFLKNFKDSLCNAVLCALIFKLTERNVFITDESEIGSFIGSDTFESLKELKSELVLDLLLRSFE